MPQYHVKSIAALEELQVSMLRYAERANSTMLAAQRALHAAVEKLDGRVRYWQREAAHCEQEERMSAAALQRCRAASDRSSTSFCTEYERALRSATNRKQQAQEALRIAMQALQAVQAEADAYNRQANGLRTWLQTDTVKAARGLSSKIEALRGYTGEGFSGSNIAPPPAGLAPTSSPATVLSSIQSIARSLPPAQPTLSSGYEASGTALRDRFEGNLAELKGYYYEAIENLANTQAGRATLSALPRGQTLQGIVEAKMAAEHIDELGYAGGLALFGDRDLALNLHGTFVHTYAHLRTLYLHPDEVLDGTRYAEQPIIVGEGSSRFKIDCIIRRGERYYIRDYKPVRLEDYEDTEEGQRWIWCVQAELGRSFRRQLALGRIPFAVSMPLEVRHQFRDWVHAKNHEHDKQLNTYVDAFVAARPHVEPSKVQAHVRSYFTYVRGLDE